MKDDDDDDDGDDDDDDEDDADTLKGKDIRLAELKKGNVGGKECVRMKMRGGG